MIIDTCAWDNPGQSPYTGTPSAWVAKLPLDQQRQVSHLLTFVQKRDYDAVVYIDKDGITDASGARTHTYENRVEYMAFGKSGTICKSISRKWDAGQVESAMLFCAGGNICVARWSVCNNYSIVYRTPVPTKTLPPVAGIPPEAPFEGGGVNPQPDAPPAGPELVGFVPPPSSDSPGYPVWVPYPVPSGGGFYPSPPTVGPTINPVGVIPEPETWALFAAGLLLMVWQGMRRRA